MTARILDGAALAARFKAEITDRVASMVTAGRVAAVDGSTIPITVESVCVHGDSPGAVQIANAVRDRLRSDGVELKAFV